MNDEELVGKPLNPQCMKCLLNQYIDACPADASTARHTQYLQRIFKTIADTSNVMTAPEISYELGQILYEMFNITPPDYSQIKKYYNQLVMGIEESIISVLNKSDDSLDLAIRCALVGNYIDFGPRSDVKPEKLLKLVEDASSMELNVKTIEELKTSMRNARTIAYLTDNCGEIVFDRILITEILKVNPNARVVAIVRGAPVLNDATIDDAIEVGLDKVVKVIENGSDVAGTCLSRVNTETITTLNESNLVISKGLANYETLSGMGRNTYYMFLCKCSLYTRVFSVPLYTGMIVNGA